MQDGFADFFRMEVPPDDLLVNDFSDEMFDMEDYLNELIPDNIDTDPANPGTPSEAEQAQQRPDLFPEATAGGLDSNWNNGTSEHSFSQGAGPSQLSGPVITTGALPVAIDQPPAFFPELAPQAPSAWAEFPAPAELPQLPGSTAQLYSSHQFGQPAQEHPAPDSPEVVLKQLEQMLKADNSPEVQERLLAIIAAQVKSAGMSGQQVTPSSAPVAPVQHTYNSCLNPASAGYANSLAGSYQSQAKLVDPRQVPQRRIGLPGQLQHSAPDQMRHSTSQQAADRLQPSLFSAGMDPYAWPASSQAASSLQHIEQPQQFMHCAPHLPQQLPSSTLPQERPRKVGPQQARRNPQSTRQTGAMSLQQQAQALLPRQEEPERIDFSSYLPSSSAGCLHSLSRSPPEAQPSSLPQEVLDPWHAPTGRFTHRPDLHRTSADSSSGQNAGQNPVTSSFDGVVGTQSMTQALLEPHAFDHLPVDDATAPFGMPFGNAPQPAPQQPALVPPVAGRLAVSQAAPLSTEVPSNMVQAASIGAAGRQQPSTLDPRLPRPTAPQRAAPPPPESRAAAGRPFLMGRTAPMADDAAAAAAARSATARAAALRAVHPMFQTTSQDSSGGSCGLAVSCAQGLQFPAITSQAAGVLPSVSPVSPDVGMQLPAFQPAARPEANQEAALDHAQADAGKHQQAQQTEATPGQPHGQQQGDNGGEPEDNGGVDLNAQGKPKRKRKRDTHQQELNKQAQHRYRERKKAKAAELAQQVQLLSTKAANLQTAKVKQAHLREHNEALRKAVEVKKAELAAAAAAAQHGSSSPPEAAPAEDTLADKVSVMERKASSLAEQLHCKVFELGRHLKQSGLDNQEKVPWDGGRANPAVLEVVRHLVHQIHIITHEAHRMEGPNVWDVVHRVVPPRQCAPGCHCLHCKDKDAWLDVAEALKLTDEQKCKIIVSRSYTDDTLRQVYEKRRALNLEAIHLMLPQSRRDMHDGKDGLKEFAELAFFSRARTTGQMSKVVDKLKANLREEACAKTKLDYSMFTKILSPVQSAWFITEAYPLKSDCQALASAVCQLWSHMFPPPAVLPAQPHQLQQRPAARQQLTQLLQQQQQQQQRQQQQQPALHQMRASPPARHLEAAQAAAVSFRHKAPPTSLEPLQPTQAGAVRQLLSHPPAASLSSLPMQQQYAASQVSQMHAKQSRALQTLHQMPAAQRAQQLRPVHAMEPQHAQHAEAAQATAQVPPAQRAQQLQFTPNVAEPSVTQQPAQPTFPSLSLQQQAQGLENRHKQHMLQQRMGAPAVQVLQSGSDLHGMRPSSLNPILSGQRFRGLGGLQASDSVRAGAMPPPTNTRLPMAVP